MQHHLKDFFIFLHGPSGAGKSEVQRKVTDQYTKEGYQVHYISSGDLFREAFTNPEIAERSRRGEFLDTLGAIVPGLQAAYTSFLKSWRESDGKAVFILDGLIRRSEFANQEGVVIPSQLDQIAEAFYEVMKSTPEFATVSLEEVSAEIRDSKQVVIEIDPRDAEGQIKRRANKELGQIQLQMSERMSQGGFPLEVATFMAAWLGEISRVVNSDLQDEAAYQRLSAEAQEMRKHLAVYAGEKESASLSTAFKALGFTTQLRDDDVSPIGRRSRIGSYIAVENTEHGLSYKPGFIMDALTTDLCYSFSEDGSISSTGENCRVIKNGASKGIELSTFQAEAENVSARLYQETARTREGLFGSPEGQRRGKEN